MFRTHLDTLGNNFRPFWIFEYFFFENFRKLEPPWYTVHKFFSKKSSENISRHFWERFWAFLDFWDFFDCSQNLEDSTLHGKLGKNLPKNFPQNMFKTRLDTFGNNFEHFWKFDIFKVFFENFRSLEPPWNTGHEIFQKNCPKTCSKHIWTLLGTILGIFGFLRLFQLFSKFRGLDPPWKTGQRFSKKFAPKHVQNTFGHFW